MATISPDEYRAMIARGETYSGPPIPGIHGPATPTSQSTPTSQGYTNPNSDLDRSIEAAREARVRAAGMGDATAAGQESVAAAQDLATSTAYADVAGQEAANVEYEATATGQMAGATDRYLGTGYGGAQTPSEAYENINAALERGEITPQEWADLQMVAQSPNWRSEGGTVQGFEQVGEDIRAGATTAEQAIADTRTAIEEVPGRIRADVAAGQSIIDQGITAAEGLVGEAREDALGNVYGGYANMLSSATASAHAAQQQNDAQINAMVQQGQISQAQANQMKMSYNVQSNMTIAQSIGDVGFQYTQLATQAQVEFGNMLTSIETSGIGATGAFQATGVQAISAMEQLVGDLNVRLTDQLVNVQNQRSTNLLMLTEMQSVADASFSEYARSMMPEIHQPFVPSSMIEYNAVTMAFEQMRMNIAAEQGQASMSIMRQTMQNEKDQGWLDFGMTLIGLFTGG
jgi:hypothetical protein